MHNNEARKLTKYIGRIVHTVLDFCSCDYIRSINMLYDEKQVIYYKAFVCTDAQHSRAPAKPKVLHFLLGPTAAVWRYQTL